MRTWQKVAYWALLFLVCVVGPARAGKCHKGGDYFNAVEVSSVHGAQMFWSRSDTDLVASDEKFRPTYLAIYNDTDADSIVLVEMDKNPVGLLAVTVEAGDTAVLECVLVESVRVLTMGAGGNVLLTAER
jgi:hypothetical protein